MIQEDKNVIKATLRLFNAVRDERELVATVPQEAMRESIAHGFILDPRIDMTADMFKAVKSIIGISGAKANASFRKSWSVVRDTLIEVLAVQQIAHYITTYGYEALGVYSDDTVYIPVEKLELPPIDIKTIPLTIVKAMTKQEIVTAIVSLGSSGIALSQQTLDDIMTIVSAWRPQYDYVFELKNRELKALLYDLYSIVPSGPVEFLRHVVSKLTDESLIIKNSYLIDKIKAANGKFLDELMLQSPANLASIFFRYKPLFLAMKSISRHKTFYNRLRKQADKMHKPLPVDYLNNVTAQIKRCELNLFELSDKLSNATIWRKIRLAYALNHRLHAGSSIIYKVRNGRGWVTDFNWPDGLQKTTRLALNIVVSSIAGSIIENVNGKTFYIPNSISYALPATEKQFTGNLPTGSYAVVPHDMVAGIHWFNTDKRVDLDLSMIDASGKLGWDAGHRRDSDILFSGDITSAPRPSGASELFYFSQDISSPKIMMANYYNFHSGDEVDCKIFVASENLAGRLTRNYMVDISNIVAAANIKIAQKQSVLGLVAKVGDESRFYFSNVAIGNSITANDGDRSRMATDYLVNSMIGSIRLADVLVIAGANVVSEIPESGEFVDLSPENLTKSTIVDLLKETN